MTRKLTTKIFIERSRKNHNNYYTYEKVDYQGRRKKVIITCPVHGDFTQIAGGHLRGHGCKICRIKQKIENMQVKKKNGIKGNVTYKDILNLFSNTKCTLLTSEDEFNSTKDRRTKHLIIKYLPSCKCEIITSKYHSIYLKMITRKGKEQRCLKCLKNVTLKKAHKKNVENRVKQFNEINRNNINGKEKLCKKCNLWLPIKMYNKQKTTLDGLKTVCSKCNINYVTELKYKWNEDEYIENILKSSKRTHKFRVKKGRVFNEPFNYTKEDVINHKNKNGEFINVFTGEIVKAKKSNNRNEQLSLDRKLSSKTYYKDKTGKTDEDNIQITSPLINKMKSDLSDEEFLSIIEKIAIYRLGMVHNSE